MWLALSPDVVVVKGLNRVDETDAPPQNRTDPCPGTDNVVRYRPDGWDEGWEPYFRNGAWQKSRRPSA